MSSVTRRTIRGGALAVVSLALVACGGSASSTESELPSGLDPQPLAEPTTITVSVGTAAESVAAFLVADQAGEFAKENLAVEVVELPSAESLPALAQGRTDAAVAGVGATFFNVVAAGSDIRLVFPGATKNPADGLYVALDPSTGKPKTIEKIAAIPGAAGMHVVPVERYLASVGQDITDVSFERVALADMPQALESEVFDAAWVNAPVTTLLEQSGKYERVVEYADGEFGIAYMLGPNLLRERPEVGQAFVRALARTVRDHLTGDYKQNADTVQALATSLKATPEEIAATPVLTFAAELPTDALYAGQQAWLAIGDILDVDEPLSPERYLDSSFLDRAMGAS